MLYGVFLLVSVVVVSESDYYADLNLSFQADANDIKKAYRKLSLQYHPDKNQGNAEAATKFQQVAKAYEILSNDETRQIFDLDGEEGLEQYHQEQGRPEGHGQFNGFFGGGRQGKPRGNDAGVKIDVSLEDLYNGVEKHASFHRNIICPKCRGTGAKDGKMATCKHCKGQGAKIVLRRMGGFTMQMQETCQHCAGRGKAAATPCPHCAGQKVVKELKQLTAEIEKGMPSEHKIVFEKESEQAPGVVPGDVVFQLKQLPHDRYRRKGNDLHLDLTLSLSEALLGYEKTVEQLDGTSVPLSQSGVTQPFQVTKVKGQGMPIHNYPSSFGNMVVQHKVQLPATLTSHQKELVKTLFGNDESSRSEL